MENNTVIATPSPAIVECEQTDERTIILSFSGNWLISGNRAGADEALARLRTTETLNRVVFKDSGISDWDSSLLVFLRSAIALAAETEAEHDMDNMPDGVKRLLRLASSSIARPGAERTAKPESLLTRIGNSTLAACENLKATLFFIGELTLAFVAAARGKAGFRRRDFIAVIQECGPEALPIISLVSVLVGMILAFLGSVQLKMFGAEIYIANAVGVGMVREMGALMTGIIMAGRTGASFAAQIGTMQVNEEVDALQTMGFSPVEFLALPRAAALIIMMPLLTLYANVLGIIGGAVVGVLMLDLTPAQYYLQTIQSISIKAVASGLIKSSVFGVLVAVSGCMQGIRCGRSASAVGEATTAAVVKAIVYIIVADAIISIIFTVTGF